MARMDDRFALAGYGTDELIGFGGTGEVWRAHDLDTGETVAIKRLRTRGAGATERLRREAALLASVAGPHVIAVRRLIVEGDEAVMVMDYAAGGSLASVLGVRGGLPAAEVVTVLAPIAAALAAAHARDLVHGDLTPANILFTADGRPLLADFGVAQALGTMPQVVEGTVDYLDPAVAAGAPLSGANDVFALAAIGYTALAGQTLWGSGTADQIQARASIGVRPALEELAPDAPPALVAAIESALRLEPADRPDARTFGHAVLRAGAAAPIGLVVSSVPISAPMTHPLRPMPAVEIVESAVRPSWFSQLLAAYGSTWRERGRWMLRLTVSVVVTMAVVPLLALHFTHHDRERDPVLTLPPQTPALEPLSVASLMAPVWKGVVKVLDGRRASAFTSGRVALLAEVYAPGSSAYATDRATLSSLASRGLRAHGLAATVEKVTIESGTKTTERLQVVDRLSAYTLVDGAGHVVGRGAARPARAFTMDLTEIGGRWRVASVAPR
jgi:eukaryotic-like serine/threonine-protein kinase